MSAQRGPLRADAGLIDLSVVLLAVAVLAAIAGASGIWAGAGLAGLLLAALAPVLVVAAVVITVSGDRRRNRFAAADGDKAIAAVVPAEAAKGDQAGSGAVAAAFAVSTAGEAERLADAGDAAVGLVAVFAAVVVPIALAVAALFPQLTSQPGTPLKPADRVVKVERVCYSTGTASDVTTWGDGTLTAVGEYPCRWRGANR